MFAEVSTKVIWHDLLHRRERRPLELWKNGKEAVFDKVQKRKCD
jgi:hypothetical protein